MIAPLDRRERASPILVLRFVRSNDCVERRGRSCMSLALDAERVRSNEVLERTRLSSPKLIQSLGTSYLALRAHP